MRYRRVVRTRAAQPTVFYFGLILVLLSSAPWLYNALNPGSHEAGVLMNMIFVVGVAAGVLLILAGAFLYRRG